MAKLRDFKMDAGKETDGVWVLIGDDLELLVASADNPEHRRYYNKLLKPHLTKARLRTMSVETMEDISRRSMARHVLLGWRNLEDDDGKPIPYSHEKALEVLTESREIFTMVSDLANDQALFRMEQLEEAEKNS